MALPQSEVRKKLLEIGSIWVTPLEPPVLETVALPPGATNVITMDDIASGDEMINFHGERNRGRYYKKSTYNSLTSNRGVKKNPFTRAIIEPQNVKRYKAKGGTKRRRTLRRRTRRRT